MLKKTITYVDYDENKRTEDFFFNLTKAEVLALQLSAEGGLEYALRKIIAAQDTKSIIELFEKIILKAYGEKSADGKRFIKSEELSAAFAQTEAYSELFMELVTDAEKAAAFINGIIPKDMQPSPDEMAKARASLNLVQ